VQAECQESSSFNRLKINKLDYVLELVRLGQIGLPRLEIGCMRMKIGGMMRSARGWDKLSQSFACLVETIESRSLRSRPINFASRTASSCRLQIVGSHPQPIATQECTIHAPASLSSVVDSCECGRVTMLIQIRRSRQ